MTGRIFAYIIKYERGDGMSEKLLTASNAVKTNIIFDLEAAYVLRMPMGFKNAARGKLERYTPYNKKFSMMLYTTSGSGKVVTKSEEFECKAGDLLFVHYVDCPTMIACEGEWGAELVWFFYENLELPLNRIIKLPTISHRKETVEKIISLVATRDYYATAQANGLAQALVCEILTIVNADGNKYPKDIAKILDRINSNTDEKITVESLAAELHLSPKHFRTLFERNVGMNPKQYITKSKLEKSQFYLTHTELSIQQIAAKLAFSSPTHYINTFTKYYRITQLLYRKDNR